MGLYRVSSLLFIFRNGPEFGVQHVLWLGQALHVSSTIGLVQSSAAANHAIADVNRK